MREKLRLLEELVSTELGGDRASETIRMILEAIRRHLRMDVAYVSEFIEGMSVFRHVDAPGLEGLIKVGDGRSLDDVYCRHILEGRLPELMSDTADYPLASAMPITEALPIGSHISVPIRHDDGSAYGMFCCLSFEPNRSLNERDLEVIKAFADIVAHQIARDLDKNHKRLAKTDRVLAAIKKDGFSILYQPIWRFGAARPEAFECLARFPGVPTRSPDLWFAEADEIGLGVELELAVISKALTVFPRFPDGVKLAVNASPKTILDARFDGVLEGAALDRLKIEITEHAPIDDYERLNAALEPYRGRGMQLAVDDAGAGFSSFRHIIHLRPDVIKLDMALTRDIDKDAARRALASALIYFAHETGSEIVAEGIETEAELQTLRTLGIWRGQGYLLGRPQSLARAAAAAHSVCPQRSGSATAAAFSMSSASGPS